MQLKNVTPMGLNDEVFKTIINNTENTFPTFFFINPSGSVVIPKQLNKDICMYAVFGEIMAIIDNEIEILRHQQILYLNAKVYIELRNNTTDNVIVYIDCVNK
ncbi:hypothetical protein P4T54_23380 [Bacillus mycoides]|uniref:hypothetical protein n=1 Tax=Bacillus mycoides TaxID=1405 RepID=UPI002E210F7E|nr:hypothetical protein [Bacillus mycoides]